MMNGPLQAGRRYDVCTRVLPRWLTVDSCSTLASSFLGRHELVQNPPPAVAGPTMMTHFGRPISRIVVLSAASLWFSACVATAPAPSTRPYQMSIISTTEGRDIVDIPIFHFTHRDRKSVV